MQSQFTDKAKKALQLAEKTAASLRQGYVGTEHILAGLLKEGTGMVAGSKYRWEFEEMIKKVDRKITSLNSSHHNT